MPRWRSVSSLCCDSSPRACAATGFGWDWRWWPTVSAAGSNCGMMYVSDFIPIYGLEDRIKAKALAAFSPG
jgi:hypothetical protein